MNTTTTALIFAGLLCIVAIGGYILAFHSVSTLQEKSIQLAEDIHLAVSKEEQRVRTESTLEEVEAQEKIVRTHLVSETTLVDFLESIEEVETTTNAEVEVISVDTNENETTFDISLVIEGGFSDVMRTIGAVENMPVYLTLVRGTIDTVLREQNDTRVWTASLSYHIGKI